jgi:hypothetical protein
MALPNGIRNIGKGAFSYCTALTNIISPGRVTSIPDNLFRNCTNLTSVMLGNCVTEIGRQAFYLCARLTNFVIPPNVKTIRGRAFSSCSSLTDLRIPGSVVNIESGAFEGCTGARHVDFGRAVTNIGAGAFAACINLTTVTIPSSVLSIGDHAFAQCINLATLYFSGNAPQISIYGLGVEEVTIYYLPGATGWDSIFPSYPTALWSLPHPIILDFPPSFGVRTNRFGFIVSWAANASVAVEACTNLANPVWSPVATNTLAAGWSYFSDPEWTNHSERFYRLRSP